MHFNFFYLKSVYIFSFFIILLGCQLKEPQQNHGILFLENRSAKLQIDISNQNDVIKEIGHPHSKSINDENEWIFIERTFTKGEFHKLGKNILKESNILVLNFDKYGILKEKVFLTKEDIKKLSFSNKETSNELSQKSFVQKFLTSLRDKMYKKK
tara:strand:- start:408 stop:872 length:465 start_codon:yes stop_codon:yes gene_type:complete